MHDIYCRHSWLRELNTVISVSIGHALLHVAKYGFNKMADIWQTLFEVNFLNENVRIFIQKFRWIVFPRVESKIGQH